MSKNKSPECLPPVTDGLAFTLAWPLEPGNEEKMLQSVRKKLSSAIDAHRCERSYSKWTRYRENFRILLEGGAKVHVGIGAVDPRRQKGGIRIKLNPAKLTRDDVQKMHKVMQRIVGPEYLLLLTNPRINVWDIAADIPDADLNYMLVLYDHATRLTMFAKRINGIKIEGYSFGSMSSDYVGAVYDKSVERRHRAFVRAIAAARSGTGIEPLVANVLKQLSPGLNDEQVLRVEVRCRKLHGIHPSKLKDLPNRFMWFKFADLRQSGTTLPPLIEKAFLAMCRQDGVKAAIADFKHTEYARAVNAYWRSRRADWWQPDHIWDQAYKELKASGIFPPEAFKEPVAATDKKRR